MTGGALILLILTISIALAAGQGLDGYGFWTALLWMLSAVGATVVVKINTSSVETPLQFSYFLAMFAMIAFTANYRVHVSFRRLLADVYSFTFAPVHAAIWAIVYGMQKLIHGRGSIYLIKPWEIMNYKPTLSTGRAMIIEKRNKRLEKLIFKFERGEGSGKFPH